MLPFEDWTNCFDLLWTEDLARQIPKTKWNRAKQCTVIERPMQAEWDALSSLWGLISRSSDLNAKFVCKPYQARVSITESEAILLGGESYHLWCEDQFMRESEVDDVKELLDPDSLVGIDSGDVDEEDGYIPPTFLDLPVWNRIKLRLIESDEDAEFIAREWYYFSVNKKRYALHRAVLYAQVFDVNIMKSSKQACTEWRLRSDGDPIKEQVADYMLIDLGCHGPVISTKPINSIFDKLLKIKADAKTIS